MILLKEAITDYRSSKLDSFTAMLIIGHIVMPTKPNERAMEWALEASKKWGIIRGEKKES